MQLILNFPQCPKLSLYIISDVELTIPEEKVNQLANSSTNKLNCALVELRRLFLVDNMLDSVKFGMSLWVLTYIGSWFNAMTLILMAWVGLFTVPKVRFSKIINVQKFLLTKNKLFFKNWKLQKVAKINVMDFFVPVDLEIGNLEGKSGENQKCQKCPISILVESTIFRISNFHFYFHTLWNIFTRFIDFF